MHVCVNVQICAAKWRGKVQVKMDTCSKVGMAHRKSYQASSSLLNNDASLQPGGVDAHGHNRTRLSASCAGQPWVRSGEHYMSAGEQSCRCQSSLWISGLHISHGPAVLWHTQKCLLPVCTGAPTTGFGCSYGPVTS